MPSVRRALVVAATMECVGIRDEESNQKRSAAEVVAGVEAVIAAANLTEVA